MNFEQFKKEFLTYPATYVITVLTTLIWLGQLLAFGSQVTAGISLLKAGALFAPSIWEDPTQLWRLFTPIFLHIGWMHFLMNMLTLVFIGRQVELIFGWKSFTGIYLLSGIFGNALTFFLAPTSLSAGASTAIFGIFGAVVGLGYFTAMPSLKQIGQSFVVLILVNLGLNLFSSGVNIWGHIGGALGGLLLSAIIPPLALKRGIPRHYFWISLVAFVALLVVFIALPLAQH